MKANCGGKFVNIYTRKIDECPIKCSRYTPEGTDNPSANKAGYSPRTGAFICAYEVRNEQVTRVLPK